jgi:hypothetical protein
MMHGGAEHEESLKLGVRKMRYVSGVAYIFISTIKIFLSILEFEKRVELKTFC